MKSKLQRCSTALLIAMVGMSLVFSNGCAGSKKKKSKEATELPDKDGKESTDASASGDTHADASGSGTTDIASSSSKDSAPPPDNFASNPPPPKDDVSPAPAGGSGSFEGLESRHGAPSIGAEDQSLAMAPKDAAPADDAPAPAPKSKKKKKGKKKKKSLEAPIETADSDPAAASDDAGGGTDSGNSYTVKKGDSLSKIAKSHGVKLKALLSANGMKMEDAAKLKVGAKLKIPASKAG